MLPITDLNGQTELLTNIKNFTRKRKVNGEKLLSFFVVPSANNEHSYGLVDVESIVTFEGEEYVIKVVNEKNVGKKTIKQVEAVHRFFNDLINIQQHKVFNGSMTFQMALLYVFEETGYTYNVMDTFYAETFENFGRDNRLSLFKRVLERYGAEFYVVGKQVYLKREIGSRTDFQYRYGHNVKAVDFQRNTRNLATRIRGYGGTPDEEGNYPIQEEYTSPNIDKIGDKEADSIYDERLSTAEGMQERLRRVLQDEPLLSITVNFVDLRATGYLYDTPNEGDYGYIIYEPMNDLLLEARIVEIDEEYKIVENNWIPIKTNITLSNVQEKATDIITRLNQTSMTMNRLLEGRVKLPYNVLDDAVKVATEALKSAQTELEFENGIIARDKNNPDFIVLLNSNGIGISRDGGETFRQAITSEGVVTDTLTAGQVNANNVSILADGIGQLLFDGNGIIALDEDGNLVAKIGTDGEAVFSGVIKTSRFEGLQGDYIDFGVGECRIDASVGENQGIRRFRFQVNPRTYIAIDENGLFSFIMDNVGAYRFRHDSETNHRTIGMGPTAIKGLGGSTHHLEIRNGSDTDYRPVVASEFITSSREEEKKNIELYTESALEKIINTKIFEYHRKDEDDRELKRVGFMYKESPLEIVDPAGAGVNDNAIGAMSWKGIQEQHEYIKKLEERIKQLESKI